MCISYDSVRYVRNKPTGIRRVYYEVVIFLWICSIAVGGLTLWIFDSIRNKFKKGVA